VPFATAEPQPRYGIGSGTGSINRRHVIYSISVSYRAATVMREEARRIAASIAKLPELLHKQVTLTASFFSALIYINAKSQKTA
jgi:hypothetical protein